MKKYLLFILISGITLGANAQYPIKDAKRQMLNNHFDSAHHTMQAYSLVFKDPLFSYVKIMYYTGMSRAILSNEYVDKITNLSAAESLEKAVSILKESASQTRIDHKLILSDLSVTYIMLYNYFANNKEYEQAKQTINNGKRLYNYRIDPKIYNKELDSNYFKFSREITLLEKQFEVKKTTFSTHTISTGEKGYIEQIIKLKDAKNNTGLYNVILKARAEFPKNYTFINEEYHYLLTTNANYNARVRCMKKAAADCPDSLTLVTELANLLYTNATEENSISFAPDYFKEIITLLNNTLLKNPNHLIIKTMCLEVQIKLLDTYIKENENSYRTEIKTTATNSLKLATELISAKNIQSELTEDKLTAVRTNKTALEELLKKLQ